MLSKFVKDFDGKSIDLKQKDFIAYNALKEFELSKDSCVVANFDGKSLLFMYSGNSKVDASGVTWNLVKPIIKLPVRSDGTPFYESGTAFPVKERYVEIYHEEYADMNHGEYADVGMRKVYAPSIDNPQKAVQDAIERGMIRQAGYRLSEGRSADGRTFNEIRILDDDMSEKDREYCKEISEHSECTIFSDDVRDDCRYFKCTREQKIEIREGRYGGLPTRNYLDTLERTRDIFVARGADTSELDKKIADRRSFESGENVDVKDYINADELRGMIESLEKMRDPKCDESSGVGDVSFDSSLASRDDKEMK